MSTMTFGEFRLKRAVERCMAAIERACGTVPAGIDVAAIADVDALAALERVFDAARGVARATRLYVGGRQVLRGNRAATTSPQGASTLEQAIVDATGKACPRKLKGQLGRLDATAQEALAGALRALMADVDERRETHRRRG